MRGLGSRRFARRNVRLLDAENCHEDNYFVVQTIYQIVSLFECDDTSWAERRRRDILPNGIEQFAPTHPGTECGKDEDVPPKWNTDLRLLSRLRHTGTFIVARDMNGPLGSFGLANIKGNSLV